MTDEQKDKIITLVKRCKADFLYFAKNFLKVEARVGGKIIPFEMNSPQKVLHIIVERHIKPHRPVRIVALKARRMGFSTYFSARFFWKSSFNRNRKAAQITHEPEATDTLFKMVKRMYDHLPKWMQPEQKYNNKSLLEFNNKDGTGLNSGFRVATAGKSDFGSGQSIHFLHLSEMAKWPVETTSSLMTSVEQTVPFDDPEAEEVIESTAKGMGGEFYSRFYGAKYRIWVKKLKGGKPVIDTTINTSAPDDNLFTSVFLPWFVFEDYVMPVSPGFSKTQEEREIADRFGLSDEQVVWRRFAIANLCKGDIDKFNQEYPDCIAAGSRVGTSAGIFKIEELVDASHCLLCADHGVVSRVWLKAEREVVRVTTSLGYSLTCTPDHWVAGADGHFVQAGASEGSEIVLQPPVFADSEYVHKYQYLPSAEMSVPITPEFGRFLGYFVGDGSYSGNTISIVCEGSDADVIADVEQLITAHFGKPGTRAVGSKGGGAEVRLSCVAAGAMFKSLGLIETKPDRLMRKVCVPEAIFRSPKPVVREFLRGLFEADGFAGYQQARMVLFSKHYDFLQDVQLLLLGFGITSRLTTSQRRNKTHEYTANELCLRAAECRMFTTEVGFVSARKQGRLVAHCNTNPKFAKRSYKGKSVTKITLSDTVTSVISGGAAHVYDATIRGYKPWFGANGILVHNCPEVAFLTSGRPVFDNVKVSALKDVAPKPIARYEFEVYPGGGSGFGPTPQGRFAVWEEPDPNKAYIVGADVAEGLEKGDFSCAYVINHQTGEMVAEWHGKIDADMFARVLYAIGMRYNTAFLAPERNNHGMTVLSWLQSNLMYPNNRIYVEMVHDPPAKPYKRYGWVTNLRTRSIMIDNLIREAREGIHGIRSADLLDEMLSFKIQKNGKMEADSDMHDDRVMAYAIAKYVKQTTPLRIKTRNKLSTAPASSRLKGIGWKAFV